MAKKKPKLNDTGKRGSKSSKRKTGSQKRGRSSDKVGTKKVPRPGHISKHSKKQKTSNTLPKKPSKSKKPSSPKKYAKPYKPLPPSRLKKREDRPGTKVKGRKIVFRGKDGRFVAESERYQKATQVARVIRDHWETVYVSPKGKPITPRTLVHRVGLNQREFENLKPNFAPKAILTPTAKKYTAWDVAGQARSVPGVRGKLIRFTMNVRVGESLKKITFYRKIPKDGGHPYGIFRQINDVIGHARMNLYTTIPGKLLTERKGRTVSLESLEMDVQL